MKTLRILTNILKILIKISIKDKKTTKQILTKKEVKMAKASGMSKLVSFVAWLTGIIVSLAVGFGLVNGTLIVPYIGIVNVIAGWIVVVLTVIGVILAIANRA